MKRQIFLKLGIVLLCITALFSLFVVGVFADTSETNKTIMAGTYCFNDALINAPIEKVVEEIPYTITTVINGAEYSVNLGAISIRRLENEDGVAGCDLIYGTDTTFSDEGRLIVYEYGWRDDFGEGIKTITVTEDTEVSYEFYIWFVLNTVKLTIDYDPTDSPSDSTASTAYQEGYYKGYSDGLSAGASSVRPVAYQEGYNAGKTDGYNEGYDSGKNVGYVDGFNDGKVNDTELTDLPFSVVDSITNVFRGMLDFEILGINVLALFVDIIALLLIVFVIKKVV